MAKLKKRADGRYVKAITDPQTKKRVYFYGASPREIDRKLMEYRTKQEYGATFSDLAEEWWAEASERISPTLYRTYATYKDRAVEQFGRTPIREITVRDVSAYLRKIASAGRAKKTVLQHKTVVSDIFSLAVQNGDVEHNVARDAMIPRDLPQKKRPAASREDEEIVKRTADVCLIPFFALYTGMRKGEIAALRWRDVDFAGNQITVRASTYTVGATAHVKPPKTEKGIRTVPLLPPLREKLEPIKGDPAAFVFHKADESPLTNGLMDYAAEMWRKKTGAKCTLHQLRHSFASIAVHAGVPPKTLQEILGHANISTTLDIYAEVRAEALNEAAALLADKMK